MRLYYKAKPNGRSYPANSEPPFHKVTHRHDKSIPGCTPAPRNGIYRPFDIDEAIADNAARAERFAVALDSDQYGPSFRGYEFTEPLFGAYGERL